MPIQSRYRPSLEILSVMMMMICSLFPASASPSPDVLKTQKEIISGYELEMDSTAMNQNRPFSIHLPYGYHQSTARYPVLYVTDGGAYAGYIAETVRLLAFQRDLPPMIVVGIPSLDRNHDLTPFPIENDPTSGSADIFLKFMEEELIPFVDREYRTEDFRILFGHSLGGSFTVYTLFSRPGIFQAGLAISPALYSDRGRLLRHVEAFMLRKSALPTSYLWMSVGAEIGYAESLDYLVERLETMAPPGLRWEGHKFPEESHGSIVMRTLDLSLKGLFLDWPLRISEINEGFEAVSKHYRDLADRLGYEFPIPELLVNQLGYRALAESDFDDALKTFRYNVEKYPASSNAYDSLGEAFYKSGNMRSAKSHYQKSLALDPNNENARTMLIKIRGSGD